MNCWTHLFVKDQITMGQDFISTSGSGVQCNTELWETWKSWKVHHRDSSWYTLHKLVFSNFQFKTRVIDDTLCITNYSAIVLSALPPQIIHWNWSCIMLQLLDARKGHFNMLQLGFGDRNKLGSPRNALRKRKKEQTHNEIRWEASINIQDIHTTPHTKVVLNSSHAFMMHKLEYNIFFVAHTAMKWVHLLQPRFRCTTLLLQRILDGWPPANPSPLRPLQRSKMIVCPSRLCVLMCNV